MKDGEKKESQERNKETPPRETINEHLLIFMFAKTF